jgi:hypothetical protein
MRVCRQYVIGGKSLRFEDIDVAEPLETNRELSGNSIPPLHVYDRISMFHTLTLTLEDDQSLVKQMTKGHSSWIYYCRTSMVPEISSVIIPTLPNLRPLQLNFLKNGSQEALYVSSFYLNCRIGADIIQNGSNWFHRWQRLE